MQANHEFIKLVRNPLKFRVFLLSKLPMALLAGLRVRDIQPEHATVSVPYKHLNKNPFRSTYFACLAMAAEMSTGLLAMMYTYNSTPTISMLVTKMEGDFIKKAVAITTFTCNDGEKFAETIHAAITTGEPQSFTANSIGRNDDGEDIAVFKVTWSFKVKGFN